MRLRSKTSLGIDISDDRIGVALLSQVNDKVKLLKAADAPVPEGAITDGNITDPALLAKAIKELLNKNKIRTRCASVSLVTKPVLIQIIDLPEEMPANLGQFIQTEIKHSPVFSGKEPYCDFCGIGGSEPNSAGRVLVGATDHDKISVLLKTLSLARVDPIAIELSTIAFIRALYAKRISGKYDSNLLTAFFHGSTLTICVFRKEELGFIHHIDLVQDMDDSDKLVTRCKGEISAVTQFYDIEVNGTNDKWEIIISSDNPIIDVQELDDSLRMSFNSDTHICTPSTIYQDTVLAENTSIQGASISAVGLAMKQLDIHSLNIKIDLMPPEAEEVRSAKKFVLITANISAMMLLIMFVSGILVRTQLEKKQNAFVRTQQENPTGSIEELLKRQRSLSDDIALFAKKKSEMKGIFGDFNNIHWDEVLHEIQLRIPASLHLKNISCYDGSTLMLEGGSLSFKSIHTFNRVLVQSELIDSATVTETSKSNTEGLVDYSIIAVLANKGL